MREEWKLAKERQAERATGGGGGEGGEGKEEGGDEAMGEVQPFIPCQYIHSLSCTTTLCH